jgi:hypothetical protein
MENFSKVYYELEKQELEELMTEEEQENLEECNYDQNNPNSEI